MNGVQVGFLRNLGFDVAFIGESEKLDNDIDIIEGNIKAQFLYGSPESIVGDIKFKDMFSAALQAKCCCHCL